MRSLFILSFIVLLLSLGSCQDVVELDVPQSEPELVLRGQLSDNDSIFVELSTTAPYFSETQNTAISGARVSLWEGDTEIGLLGEEAGRAGYYSANFKGTPGKVYHIEAEINGDYPAATLGTWTSFPDTLRVCPTIDSIRQATLNRSTTPQAFEEGEYALLYFGDIAKVKNSYRIKRTLNDSAFAQEIILFNDEGFDGLYFGSAFFPPIAIFGPFEEPQEGELGDSLVVRLESISADFENFLTLLNSQTQVGSPFDAPPALVVGNIHRKGNTKDYAFGYFSVVGTSTNSIRYQP